MHPLIQRLIERGPVLTDGAWGTQLQARGLQIGESPDGWNLLHPDRVADVARAYVEAGSQIILTNTFGTNRLRLAEQGLAGKTADLNRSGVEISRRAAAERALVFGSIGPSGKLLLDGAISAEELRAAFDEQAQALAEAGADGLVIETMTDLEEAKLALAAAKSTRLPVVACMVFDSGKDKDRTMMGHTPEEVACALSQAGADAIGANCGHGIPGFASICRRLRAATDLPIWLKPNAGLPQMVNGQPKYTLAPDEFATSVSKLVELGANFIGGCCGTDPEFIRALHRRLREKTAGLGAPARTL